MVLIGMSSEEESWDAERGKMASNGWETL